MRTLWLCFLVLLIAACGAEPTPETPEQIYQRADGTPASGYRTPVIIYAETPPTAPQPTTRPARPYPQPTTRPSGPYPEAEDEDEYPEP